MIQSIDITEADILEDDPVRPHISKANRLTNGREVFVLKDIDLDLQISEKIAAVICVAYTNKIPRN